MKRLVGIAALSAALFLGLHFVTPLNAQEKAGAEKTESSSEADPVWRWANFAILVVGLGYLAGKSLPAMFRARTAEIQSGIAEAQKVKQDADRRAASVEARMKTLGAEIEEFRSGAKVEMQQEGERIRQETAHHIARLEHQSTEEIESASKAAQRELKAHTASLALQLAEQRLRSQVGAGEGLVNGFINDLGRQKQMGQETRN